MNSQKGLSLIELMVALVLSSLLILGITQVYIDNKRNYVFQQGQSDNIESARYAILLLEEELYRAGYRTRPDRTASEVFRPATEGDCSFGRGETLNFDVEDQRICLRYQPALPTMTVCSGEVVNGSAAPYSSVDPVTVELQVANNSLFCNGSPLIANMADIKLSFGVSEDEGIRDTQKFTDAPDDGEVIRSVRYAVLLKSRSLSLADSTVNPVYRDWRAKWYSENNATAPDRALYLAVENTVTLRN
ncbi:type IV pilus assembly protein PilW [Halopseudomonas formosensis]|uniref:Type IV pilus assembly protein PilW n=1 Tax=Halopseudomonas formosensis TaxID=1002526 RepID=A0A1I6C3I6_9GAMM|nr:prepilin-type N-terminal cleavage/methylation domain-containing protein [Halopseudomonas formosensis]SFQ87751.1 type IV pilus assembly protein PilW [Halopseudomonas formosensis]